MNRKKFPREREETPTSGQTDGWTFGECVKTLNWLVTSRRDGDEPLGVFS